MGYNGYLRTLQLAGIDTSNIAMPHQMVVENFNHFVQPRESYDPSKIVELLTKESKDVQSNPDFFDNVQPRKTFFEKMKQRLSKLFTKS